MEKTMNSIYYAYLTALFLLIVGYVAGYVVGRLDLLYRTMRLFVAGLSDVVADKPKDFFKKAAADDRPKATKIAINDSKFVAPVKTDSLTKSNETTIGKTTTTDDDIQTSVSRLAQLKGK
jgi:hypothetical protein